MVIPEMLLRNHFFSHCELSTEATEQFFKVHRFMWSYFFTSVSKKMGTFFSDEQTRWAPFFQMSKPDEHYSLDEHVEMRTFSQMSKLRWALFICRWALFTYEMSTFRQCGCEDQLIFIFWLFLTIFNLPLFIWILLKLFNIVCPSNFFL